jgi:mRNA-degrading endonuclease toxin of MazEF toxin-antitoxin module
MRRGMIVWVNLDEVSPPEFGKTRPGLVISNTEQNVILDTVVILPISSKPPHIWPLRLQLKMPKGKYGFVVIPGVRQVSKTRLLDVVGQASPDFLEQVDEALQAYLGD